MIANIENFDILNRILGKVEIETIIKKINGRTLKQTERNYLSRSIRPKLMAAKILTDIKLLDKINLKNKDIENEIIYNLDKYGYSLITAKKINKQKIHKIEELIGIIISKIPKPRFIEAIPIILLKNPIDHFKLAEVAYKYDIINQIGFLVEIANMIASKFKIKNNFNLLLKYLKENKSNKISNLSEYKDPAYNEFLEETSHKLIKKWNLIGRFFDDDFMKLAEVYL